MAGTGWLVLSGAGNGAAAVAAATARSLLCAVFLAGLLYDDHTPVKDPTCLQFISQVCLTWEAV